jgi:hypothetical protein
VFQAGCFLNTGQKQYCWIQLDLFLMEIFYLCLQNRASVILLRTRKQLINNVWGNKFYWMRNSYKLMKDHNTQYIIPVKHESNIWKLSSCLAVYAASPFQKYQLVSTYRKMIPVCSENCMKHINTLCCKNTKFLKVNARV